MLPEFPPLWLTALLKAKSGTTYLILTKGAGGFGAGLYRVTEKNGPWWVVTEVGFWIFAERLAFFFFFWSVTSLHSCLYIFIVICCVSPKFIPTTYNQQQSFSTKCIYWLLLVETCQGCIVEMCSQVAESTYRSDILDLDWCLALFRNVWLCADILSLLLLFLSITMLVCRYELSGP